MSRVPNFPDYDGIAQAVVAYLPEHKSRYLDAKVLAALVKADRPRKNHELCESFDFHIYEMIERAHHG